MEVEYKVGSRGVPPEEIPVGGAFELAGELYVKPVHVPAPNGTGKIIGINLRHGTYLTDYRIDKVIPRKVTCVVTE